MTRRNLRARVARLENRRREAAPGGFPWEVFFHLVCLPDAGQRAAIEGLPPEQQHYFDGCAGGSAGDAPRADKPEGN
jgi:hypothetical protein